MRKIDRALSKILRIRFAAVAEHDSELRGAIPGSAASWLSQRERHEKEAEWVASREGGTTSKNSVHIGERASRAEVTITFLL